MDAGIGGRIRMQIMVGEKVLKVFLKFKEFSLFSLFK